MIKNPKRNDKVWSYADPKTLSFPIKRWKIEKIINKNYMMLRDRHGITSYTSKENIYKTKRTLLKIFSEHAKNNTIYY
jgi:hypothetical protein